MAEIDGVEFVHYAQAVRITDEGGRLLAVFTASGYRKEGTPTLPTA